MSDNEMNEQKHEQLSALIDDELTHEAALVIDNLLEDKQAREIWTRYHLIGDSLRGHLPERYENTADRISAAIASEPTVLAPPKKITDGKSSALLKPVMGFAIAASVAAVAIFNVQQANQVPTAGQSGIVQSSIATNTPSIATPQPASQQNNQIQSPDPRLSRYLVNYNEYRVNTGVRGMPPHVRMVANDAEIIK